MKAMNCIVLTLVIIGALNWGLIGFFGFDLVTFIFGKNMLWLSRVVFAIVGLAGIYAITFYSGLGQSAEAISMRHSKQN